jgi:phytoene synthase
MAAIPGTDPRGRSPGSHVTRKTSFYFSFLVLPKRKRDVIIAVWDFCRAVDDSVDLEPDPAKAEIALGAWRDEVARVFADQPPATSQGRALQPFAKPYHLPKEQFDALIDGVGMDVSPRRYATFAELEPYCHRVASSVGMICAEIFEYRDRAVLEYARDLGVALQLTNILRDVGVDYQSGRMYLPTEDLARFGCSEADIVNEIAHAGHGLHSDRVRQVLDHQADRARIFFDRAIRALPKEELPAVVAAEIMRAIYTDLLNRLEAANYDVFTRVIRAPRYSQARIALRTWWSIRFGRSRR